jgi:hypothetical protein
VADLSRGLPRRINVLCDRALQEGRVEGVSVISTDLVKRAARAVAGVHDPRPVAPAAPLPAPAPVAEASSPHAVAAAAPEPIAEASPLASVGAETSAVVPATEVAVPVDMPGLSFGHPVVEEEVRGRWGWKPVLGAVILVAAVVVGYGVWATMVGTPASLIPAPPTTRVLSGGAPVAPMPVPSPEELEALLSAPVSVRRPAVVGPEGEGAVPPPAGPLPSGQNPDNSNQVN